MINQFQFLDENSIRELSNLKSPFFYNDYHNNLLESLNKIYLIANDARLQGIDVSERIESRIVYDLADRVAKMHDINITNRLRDLLSETTKEKAALKISEEIAQGEYSADDLRTRLDNAVRVSLAIVTEGVTVAPLQGISDVQIKANADRSQYLSISFAGPIRSAGGTEAALTMLIADHVRKAVGLSKYQANSFDDETGRFVEELRIYEREVGNFQFKILDEDVIKCISNLPVELDGVDTDPVEIVGHRGMKRINTDRVRGGALRVMNDGLIGRSRKLLKIIDTLGLEGWDWLKELKGAIQKEGSSEDDTVHHRMSEVITGRPVLSMSNKIGGFRLRYGRCYNTGFSTIGIHPTVPILLNYAIVVGTQIKIDTPGKAATIALVDSIEPPLVKLDDGTVTYVLSIEYARQIQNRIDTILYLGDILISYGDFLENNAKLFPASYVEEIWALELQMKIINLLYNNDNDNFTNDQYINKIIKYIDKQRLFKLANNPIEIIPTFKEAFLISKILNIPLHPKYSFYWESISVEEVILLRNEFLKKSINEKNNDLILHKAHTAHYYYESFSIIYNEILKDILERLGVTHSIKNYNNNSLIELTDLNQINSLYMLLCNDTNNQNDYESLNSPIEYIIRISGILLKPKFSSSIAVRVGRPEKAAERKMKPPVHVLFPVGDKGGPTRDLIKASKEEVLYTEIANRYCKTCNLPSVSTKCRNCLSETPMSYICRICRETIKARNNSDKKEVTNRCTKCRREGKTYSAVKYPLKKMLKEAEKILEIQSKEPLKGVKILMGKNKSAEPIEKGILRQKYDLYAFKDGTIRFDATNEPLTHFKPKWIMTNVDKLRKLGYSKDFYGKDLSNEDQLLEIFIQDVILPIDTANHLLQVSKYIDKELLKLYKLEPFYNASSIDDLIGHIIIGLAPHTSVGIIGRIIGYTNSQVCLASPMWHSAKRRDCDGDADSIMLLMDVFLNFSKEFLPDKIGGLMDAPLLVQPIVLPHEVQRQALNIDVTQTYPLQLYEKSLEYIKAENLSNNIDIIKNRIGSELQFYNYFFTHHTNLLTVEEKRSAYSRLTTMNEKLDMQISTAKLIKAVIPDEVASMVLTTHIIPDIMGNMRSYSSQAFRCTNCGEKYRRIPIAGKCLGCGNNLIQTVTRNSVEKYVYIALDIRNKFKMNDYLSSRIESLVMELNYVFKEKKIPKNPQSSIFDFMDH
ncbi:MAG TPA: DNA polymerase II large subunit [Nitrososphaeraceae archaeon]|nr:DNA polymerase II large subunit [Nitrososphaeraceae archaeon]